MIGNSWIQRATLLAAFLVVLVTNTVSERQCATHLTTNYGKSNSNKIYTKHGDSFNLDCILSEERVQQYCGNLSDNIYFTRNNELLPNDMIQILSGSTVRLHIKNPPKSESVYECRLKNSTKPICSNTIVVDARPLSVKDINCINYNLDNFICTWTQPESFAEITYDVKYYFSTSTDNDLTVLHPNKCPNLIYHNDSKQMSCLGTLEINSYGNKTHEPFYLTLEMTNVFGITAVHKKVPQFQHVPVGSSQDFFHQPEESIASTATSIASQNSPFKVVCYVYSRSRIRDGIAKFLPRYIDPDLCTHIIYIYAILDETNLTLKPEDALTESETEYYKNITALKTTGVKVLLGFIGWEESIKEKYSRLVNDPVARKQFITNAVEYIQKHNFDGLDLVWFYPKCWQGYCDKGPESDKLAFAAFVRELHDAFAPKNLLLSALVSHGRREADVGYDVPMLSRYLDWITVLCFHYQGSWRGVTGHITPLYVHDEDKNVEDNSDFSIHYYIDRGANRQKLIMGIPAFGELFMLTDSHKHGLYAPVSGGRVYSHFELCKSITKGWTVVQDEKKRMGPYAYFGDQWISFDDVAMVQYKSEYIKSMGLGGAMIWTLDFDDFDNVCGCGDYPLLKTINRVLRNYTKLAPNCQIGVNHFQNLTIQPE